MSNRETAPNIHWWQRKEIIITFAIIGILVLIAVPILAHAYHWDTTTATTTEVTRSPQQKVTTTETGKTLLDWLQLIGVLAIPIVVAVGTAVFTTRQTRISEANRKQQNDISEANRKQQHDTDVQIAETQQQEELLRTYFDKLSDLLLDEKLNSNPNIQSIVRARTLAALHMLNLERKAIVLRFLHDADLLQYVKSFLYSLDLSHTDLNSINLSEANLFGANLRETNLSRANLSRANLFGANLSGADLRGADLRMANLSRADLSKANLRRADLSRADLSRADLSEADLSMANLRMANLWGADLSRADLRGATATSEQFTEANNVTPEQHAQIRPSKPAASQEATTEQPSTTPGQSEIKPDQTSQEEAEQREHIHPKQDTDAAH